VNRSLLLLCLALAGCSSLPANPSVPESPPSIPPEPENRPAQILGSLTLEVSPDLSSAETRRLTQARAALPDSALTFTQTSYSEDVNALTQTRFVKATYAVVNNTTSVFKNLSLMAYVYAPETLGSTALLRLFSAAGNPISDSSIARAMKPTHGMSYDSVAQKSSVVANQADFQVFDDTETSALETQGRALVPPVLTSSDKLLPYGFTVRGGDTSRTLAAGANGVVTVAFKLPNQSASDATKPRRFSIAYLLADSPTLRVTRSTEEGTDTNAVQARAAAFALDAGITGAANILANVQVALVGPDAFTAAPDQRVTSPGRKLGAYTRTAFANRRITTDPLNTSLLSCDDVRGTSTSCNLTVSSASYAGLGLTDTLNGVDLESVGSSKGNIVLGGVVSGNDFGKIPSTLLSGGNGAVLRLDPTGKTVLSVTRVGTTVSDLELNHSSDEIAVAGDFGVAVLNAGGGSVKWSIPSSAGYGAASRVSTGADGKVVGLFGKTTRLFSASGTLLRTVTLGDSTVNDVSIDTTGGRFFITGNAQRDGSGCSQLRVAWVRAYDFTTTNQTPTWTAYDYAKGVADAKALCADTVGARVSMGRDGKLYFAGYSAGGNSIFSKQSNDLNTNVDNPSPDSFQRTTDTKSNNITYFARLNPSSGLVEKGSFLLSRLDTSLAGNSQPNGNTIQPFAINADETGRVFVAGFSAYQIDKRNVLNLNGITLAPYTGRDAFVLVMSPDLSTRLTWTVFNNGGQGEINGVAASSGSAAVAVKALKPNFVNIDALQSVYPSGTGSTTGFFSSWTITP